MSCWFAVYTGLPNTVITYQGSQLHDKLIGIAQVQDRYLQITGVETHEIIGIGERYHQRSIYLPKVAIGQQEAANKPHIENALRSHKQHSWARRYDTISSAVR